MGLRILIIWLGVMALLVSSCAPKTKVLDYSAYPELPMTMTTKAFRLVTRTPLTKEALYYGNYGGAGSREGAPIDALDDIFRRHDIAYDEATLYEQTITADRVMVDELKALDAESLGPKAVKFRDRAVKFFTSGWSKLIGKPFALLFGVERKPRCIGMDAVGGNTSAQANGTK